MNCASNETTYLDGTPYVLLRLAPTDTLYDSRRELIYVLCQGQRLDVLYELIMVLCTKRLS